MKTGLKNNIIDVLEYFEHGLADVQEGSGEKQPKLKEIRSILRRLKANDAEQSELLSAFCDYLEKTTNIKPFVYKDRIINRFIANNCG